MKRKFTKCFDPKSLLTLALMFMFLNSNAQTADGVITVRAPQIESTKGYSNSGDYYNFMMGDTFTITYNDISVSLSLSENQELKTATLSYQLGSVKAGTINTQLSQNTIIVTEPLVFNNTDFTSSNQNTLTFTLNYTYSDTSQSDQSADLNGTITDTTTGIYIWPAATTNCDTQGQTVSVLASTPLTDIGPINYNGGNSDGWSCAGTGPTSSEWLYGNDRTSYVGHATPNNNGDSNIINTVTATIKNTAPGNGAVVWYTQDYSFYYDTYPYPEVTYQNFPSGIFLGSAITGSVSTKGGNPNPSSWSFSWSPGEITGENYSYVPQSTGETQIVVIAKNQNPDNNAVWYTSSNTNIKFVNVYSVPTASAQTATQSIFTGDDVTLIVNTNDGYAGGWSYTWEWSGSALTGSSIDSNQIILRGNAQNGNQLNQTVTCHATNTIPYGESKTIDVIFTVNVYSQPEVSITNNSNGNNFLPGQTISLTANPSGGDDAAWTYSWTGGDLTATQTAKNISFSAQNTGTSKLDKNINLSATNTPSNLVGNGKTVSSNFPYTVWPNPKLSTNTESFLVFSGTPVNLSVTAEGGNPSGWNYSWQASEGTGAQNNNSYTITPENTGTDSKQITVTVTATNNYGGTSNWSDSKTFTITVYPNPAIEWNGSYNETDLNVLNGTPVELTVAPSVMTTNASNWSYNWSTTSGTSSINGNGVTATLNAVNTTNREGPIETIVSVTGTYSQNGITPNDSKTSQPITQTYKVWSTPEITQKITVPGDDSYSAVNSISVFSNQELILQLVPTGGNPDGWTYTWSGTGVTNQDSQSINFKPTNNGTTPQQIEVNVNAANNYGGSSVWDNEGESYTFTITVYPDPQISWAQEYNKNLLNGNSLPLEVNPSVMTTDNNNWSYSWSATPPSTITGNTTTNAILNAVNNNSDNSLQTTVSVIGTYKPENIYPVEGKTATISEVFTVYPDPKVEQVGNNQVVFSGTPVTLSVETSGGNPEGWTYSWSGDGVSGSNTNPEITITPTNTGTGSQTYTVRVNVTNNYGGTSEWNNANTPYEFTIIVWPNATATLSTDPANASNVLSGTPVQITITPDGGDPTAWQYTWTMEYESIGTNSPTYTFNETNFTDSPITKTVNVIAKNSPANIDAAKEIPLSYPITVWPEPSVEPVPASQVVFSGANVTLTLNTLGGNPDGWSFNWQGSEGLPSGDLTHSNSITIETQNTSDQTSKTYTFTVSATNNYGGTEEWQSTQQTFIIVVWPKAESNWQQSYPTDVISGTAVSMEVTYSGGDSSKWNFDWKVDGNTQQSGTSAQYSFQGTNNNTNGSIQTLVSVTATNTPEGIDNEYSNTLEHSFNVWPRPALTSQNNETAVIFSGQTVDLSVTMQGGVSTGWSYEWQADGQGVGSSMPSYNYSATNFTNTSAEHTITVKVTNTCSGVQVFDQTYTFTVTVWPSATASFAENYPTDIISGESQYMSINVSGGDPTAWTYSWMVDGVESGTDQDYTFTASNNNANGSISTVVTANAKNSPAGIRTPYPGALMHTFNVWPVPMLQSKSNDDIGIYSGTTLPLSVTMQGGVATGWNYEWEYMGTIVSTGPSYTYNDTSEGTRTVIARVTNTCNGNIVFNEEYTFTITVYQPASATFESTYPIDVISGTTINMGVYTVGGDSESWGYNWNVDNSLVSTSKYYNLALTNNNANGSVTRNVVVNVANTPPNITMPYTTTLNHAFTVWPMPALANRSESNITVYTGSQVPLNVTMQGGVNTAWSYRWEYNGETVGDGANYTFNANSNGTYGLICYVTNTCNGSIVFNESYDFEIVVWDVPVATLGGAYPTNVINGQEIPMSINLTGGESNKWSILWRVNNEDVSNETYYYYTASNTSANEPVNQIVQVQATNSPTGISTPYVANFEHTYTVWPTPMLASITNQNLVGINGSSITMNVEMQGGFNQGWSYQWSLNGTVLGGASANTYQTVISNTGSSLRYDTYSIRATNTLNGEVVFDETYEFTVTVYPQASARLSQTDYEVYYGSTADLQVLVSGGNPDGWTYSWDTPTSSNSNVNPVEIPESTENNYQVVYNVTVQNRYGNELWYNATLPVNIRAWSRGSITSVPLDSLDYNYSANLILTTNIIGGYTGENGGWTYQWYENGNPVSGTNVYDVSVRNNGSIVQTYNYQLRAQNTLNGEIGSSLDVSWDFRVWPEIIAPEEVEATATSVRTGDEVTLYTNPDASGGYTPNGDIDWKYTWTLNGNTIGTGPQVTVLPGLGELESMGTAHYTYQLSVENMGPNGVAWYNGYLTSPLITVYAAPEAPLSLQRKGDGTSNTMIAMCALPDTRLAELEYYFVFGYTSSDGTDHGMGATPNRYQNFESSVYHNEQNRFWVYSQWTYPDGNIVTSGKRYLDGTLDQNFNGSTFDELSRGESAGVESLYGSNNVLETDGYSFHAKSIHVVDAEVKIFSYDGAMVRKLTYLPSDMFDEKIDLKDLPKGMYIVEVNVGRMYATRKIVIKR